MGTWVRDRFGGTSKHQKGGGWAEPGFMPFGKWEAMWEARGPLVECEPWAQNFCPERPGPGGPAHTICWRERGHDGQHDDGHGTLWRAGQVQFVRRIVPLEEQVARVNQLLREAKLVSPSERMNIAVGDVEWALGLRPSRPEKVGGSNG